MIVSCFVISFVQASSLKYLSQSLQCQYAIFPSSTHVAAFASTFTALCTSLSTIILIFAYKFALFKISSGKTNVPIKS